MIELHPMTEQHVDRTCDWLAASDQLRTQIDTLDVPTPEGNRRYWQRNFEDDSREDFAIIADGTRHIGNCGLVNIDRRRAKAELWIYLGETYGKGFGRHALSLLLDRAFGVLDLRRVYLRVVETNQRALAFYLRAGMKIEGHARSDTIQNGKSIDSILLSVLRDEYVR